MAAQKPPRKADVDSAPADGASADVNAATLTFEAALASLEGVVERLEKGELSLEESLVAYEDGVRLVHAAKGKLDAMQTRLEQLLDDGSTRALKKASDKAATTDGASPESDSAT